MASPGVVAAVFVMWMMAYLHLKKSHALQRGRRRALRARRARARELIDLESGGKEVMRVKDSAWWKRNLRMTEDTFRIVCMKLRP